ncbi:hypothetical protein ACFP3Q_00395 [Nocardioides sp. GCM10027113]|uniref:hypothetical protein n=1 Tax=unclassified Nocardioides TaxID=2615069 RepID=UPI00360FF188
MTTPVRPRPRDAAAGPLPERLAGLLARLRAGLGRPVVVAGLVMVALQLGHRAWAVLSGFFYFDDYVLLLEARERGLTLDYLAEPFNSHLMPGTRALLWLVDASGPLNWGLAATLTLALQAAASLAALWMLVVLFGPRWQVLVPLAVYLTTASTAQATLWWISSLNQISIQATFFVAVGAWVRYLRSRRLAWLLGAAGAVATGLLFFQKALLVLPVLVLLALAFFATGGLAGRITRLARCYWPALVVMGGVAGLYAVYALAEVPQPFTEPDLDAAALAWNMASSTALAAWGGPWLWEWQPGGAWAAPPTWLQAAALLATAAVVVLSVARRRSAAVAWLLLAGYVTLDIVLVATSRAPVFGAEIGLAYRLQTDVVCALVLTLGLLLLPVRGAADPGGSRGARRSARTGGPGPRLLVGVTAVVALSGLFSWTTYANLWHDRNASEAYVRTLDAELDRTGRVFLADQEVPDDVMPAELFAPDDNRLSVFTRLLRQPAEYPTTSSRLAIADEAGTLHQALLEPVLESPPGPSPGCGWLGRSPAVRIPLSSRTIAVPWWVRIGYLSSGADRVTITLGDQQREEVELAGGLGSLFVRTEAAFDEVALLDLDPGTSVCVDVVEVGDLVVGPRL